MKITQFSSLEERFHSQFLPVTETGCWLWEGHCSVSGYGQIKDMYRTKLAHRVSWELHKGEVPEGLYVCHICDVRCCVNPDHLFVGTAKDNVLDAVNKGRHPGGETHNKAKLDWDLCEEIRESEESSRVIARRLGVHRTTIQRVRSGKLWNAARRVG